MTPQSKVFVCSLSLFSLYSNYLTVCLVTALNGLVQFEYCASITESVIEPLDNFPLDFCIGFFKVLPNANSLHKSDDAKMNWNCHDQA